MAKRKRATPIPISPHAAKFMQLLDLKKNWNSYGAEPIDFEAAQAADLFLNKQVNIVPTSKGGVQLEWHVNGLDIEIEFDKNGIVGALVAYDRKP
jgi:hypothetical protein